MVSKKRKGRKKIFTIISYDIDKNIFGIALSIEIAN
jgi:hypothetical protein